MEVIKEEIGNKTIKFNSNEMEVLKAVLKEILNESKLFQFEEEVIKEFREKLK